MSQRDEDVNTFIDLVESWNARDWGGYLLWEVLTGVRDRPFRLIEQPLSVNERATLVRLRDEHSVWPIWDNVRQEWRLVALEHWAQHATHRSSKDVLDELHFKANQP